MKVWSNTLQPQDFFECARLVNMDFPGAVVAVARDLGLVVGKRSRRFEHVNLRSPHGRYHPNSGTNGALTETGEGMAASWTEWGWFLARVFERDPEARCGDYHGREDFHAQTRDRFREPRSPRELQVRRTIRSAA